MSKRLVTLLTTLALALGGTSVATADDDDFDPSSVDGWVEDAARGAFATLEETLLAMGVAPADLGDAIEYLSGDDDDDDDADNDADNDRDDDDSDHDDDDEGDDDDADDRDDDDSDHDDDDDDDDHDD